MNQPMQAGQENNPYGQPGGQPAYPMGPQPSVGTGAMVFGIVSMIFSWFLPVGLITGIVAIVKGVKGGKAAKQTGASGGKATAGLVTGILGTIGSLTLGLAVGAGLAAAWFFSSSPEGSANINLAHMQKVVSTLAKKVDDGSLKGQSTVNSESYFNMMQTLYKEKALTEDVFRANFGGVLDQGKDITTATQNDFVITGPASIVEFLVAIIDDGKPAVIMTLSQNAIGETTHIPLVYRDGETIGHEVMTWEQIKAKWPESEVAKQNIAPADVYGKTPFHKVSPH